MMDEINMYYYVVQRDIVEKQKNTQIYVLFYLIHSISLFFFYFLALYTAILKCTQRKEPTTTSNRLIFHALFLPFSLLIHATSWMLRMFAFFFLPFLKTQDKEKVVVYKWRVLGVASLSCCSSLFHHYYHNWS